MTYEEIIKKTRDRFTKPEEMAASLMGLSLREGLSEALHCLEIAREPANRFGGLTVEETAAVVPVCEAFLGFAFTAAKPIAQRYASLRAEGLAMDEVWSEIEGQGGFAYGDSQILELVLRNT